MAAAAIVESGKTGTDRRSARPLYTVREDHQESVRQRREMSLFVVQRKATANQPGEKSALAMANPGTHASFLSSQLSPAFACLLNSHNWLRCE
jgi:hypothetical protein